MKYDLAWAKQTGEEVIEASFLREGLAPLPVKKASRIEETREGEKMLVITWTAANGKSFAWSGAFDAP